jgi:hypothetical protein
MTEKRKEEYLRILKEMSTQKDVPGGISNKMYSDLRRKFPWHFLMFSWNNKSERAIEMHKRMLIEQYRTRVEILLKSELTEEDVDDLELINESLVKMEKTHILTMLYRSHLTIFSIDNQHEKGSKKNAMEWSTTAYFPIELHSDQIWRDLGAFYSLVGVLEKFLKI